MGMKVPIATAIPICSRNRIRLSLNRSRRGNYGRQIWKGPKKYSGNYKVIYLIEKNIIMPKSILVVIYVTTTMYFMAA